MQSEVSRERDGAGQAEGMRCANLGNARKRTVQHMKAVHFEGCSLGREKRGVKYRNRNEKE